MNLAPTRRIQEFTSLLTGYDDIRHTADGSTTIRIWRHATLTRGIIVALLLVLTLGTFFGYQRVQAAQREYLALVEQLEDIHQVAATEDVMFLSYEDVRWLESEFATLEERVHRLEGYGRLPFGLEQWIGSWRWFEPRYTAATDTFELALMLADSGRTISSIGAETIAALDDTGIRAEPGVDRDTWLDVIDQREPELLAAVQQIDIAMELRERIDEAQLPDGAGSRLQQIDSLMARFSEQLELVDDLPLAHTLLGTEQPRRYLVLFQNPSEMRPTGGFPGTIALVDVHRGQIAAHEFFDIYLLSQDFQEHREEPVDAPWAIHEYIRPDGLQVHDANWWADFPRTAELLHRMYDTARWPEIDGLVVVQPDVMSDLMTVTGSITVDVLGQPREITAENLLEEAERQRRIQRDSGQFEIAHKEVIASIGEVLLEELSRGDRAELIDSIYLLFDAADRRDMQVYFTDAAAWEFVSERGWDGKLVPDPGVPTLAPVFANITGLKTSLAMQPYITLEFAPIDNSNQFEVTLTLMLENQGSAAGDPFYEGFQRWWVEIMLPDNAELIGTSVELAPTPETMSGGGYVVNVHPEDRKDVVIRFRMPNADQLLLRRQPGLRFAPLNVGFEGCDAPTGELLTRDALINLEFGCPLIRLIGEDDPE